MVYMEVMSPKYGVGQSGSMISKYGVGHTGSIIWKYGVGQSGSITGKDGINKLYNEKYKFPVCKTSMIKKTLKFKK